MISIGITPFLLDNFTLKEIKVNIAGMTGFRNLRSNFPFLLAVTVIISYYLYFLSDVILSPNSFMNAVFDDGIKNYFTFAYHTAHSGTSLHFTGMNYPFGEHVIYTDGMPLLGFLLGWIPFLKGHEVGVLNVFMFGSVLIAALLIWKIFMQLKVNSWIAGAGVIGIILLSPQFFRFNGHYALSIMWVIPLIILQLLKLYETKNPIKRSLVLAVTVFLLFFIHPYMGLMSLVFAVLTISMFFLWKHFNLKTSIFSVGIIASSAVLFKVLLFLTDTHIGRTDKPSGLFEHYAMPETVFVPYFSPFKSVLEFFIPVKNGQPYEGWGYIGFSVILILLFTVIHWIVKMIQRKGERKSQKYDPFKPIFAAAILVLLFSMLIPLKWFPEDFVYKLKVFNQFRSVGRFSWVFYYTAGIMSVLLLNDWYNKSKDLKKKLIIVAITAFPILAIIETVEAYSFFTANLGKHKNLFFRENLEDNKDWMQVLGCIEKEKNAVLLPLPFFHVGSEHTFRLGTPEIQQISCVMSYHSGLPMLGSMMSRTSVAETISLFKLFAPGSNGSTNLNEIRDKNLLIITSNQALDKYEQEMLNASKMLYEGQSISLYKLNYAAFEAKQIAKVKSQRSELKENFVTWQDFQLSDSAFIKMDDFETYKSEHVFAGKGALQVKKSVYSFLSTIETQGDTELEASFWYYKGKTGLYNAMVIVEEIDTITKAGNWIHVSDAKGFPVLREEWVLVEVPLVMKKGPYKYNLLVVGDQKSDGHFFIDNLIIRDKALYFSTSSGKWCPKGYELFNNVPFKPAQ